MYHQQMLHQRTYPGKCMTPFLQHVFMCLALLVLSCCISTALSTKPGSYCDY